MSKRCTKCGSFLMDDERFCPSCGENVTEIPVATPIQQASAADTVGAATATTAAAANTYSYSYTAPQTQYQNPYYAPQQTVQEERMTLGQWVLTVCLTNLFGIVSLILLFVWGFGSGPEERRLYCKAALIFQAIVLVLYILLMILYFSVFAGMFGMIFSGAMNDSLSSALSMFF